MKSALKFILCTIMASFIMLIPADLSNVKNYLGVCLFGGCVLYILHVDGEEIENLKDEIRKLREKD